MVEGGSPECDNSTKKLREWYNDKGKGAPKAQNFVDVGCEWLQMSERETKTKTINAHHL